MSLTSLDSQLTLLGDFCERSFEDPNTGAWFSTQMQLQSLSPKFYLAFGMINKKVARQHVTPEEELADLFNEINPAFNQQTWTRDQFCRLALLLSLPAASQPEAVKTLLSTGDIGEQVSIYRSVQYLPDAERFEMQVIDGIRTNMIDVFDAIAIDNSFPFRYFKESAWNQMVLKAIFMERPLYRIYGLDERRNQDLARISHDFAHERWSAHRVVTPELWRLTVGLVDEEILADLKKIILGGDKLEKEAGIKVIEESDHEAAASWLEDEGHTSYGLSWNEIGQKIRKSIENN